MRFPTLVGKHFNCVIQLHGDFHLVEILRCSLCRVPRGELYEGEVFPWNYPNRPELSEAVEGVAEILQNERRNI